MNSAFGKLNLGDIGRGLVTAIFAGLISVLYGVTAQAGFDLFSADWAVIGKQVLNISLTTFLAYMSKNLLTDSSGRVLGVPMK